MRVDPDRRCSVMLIYGTHLVVLPFRQEGILDEHEQEGAFTGRYSVYVATQSNLFSIFSNLGQFVSNLGQFVST